MIDSLNPLLMKNNLDSDIEKKIKKFERLNSNSSSFQHVLSNEINRSDFNKDKDKKLWDACVEVESIFVGQMVKEMKKTVQKGDLFHGGQAEEYFEDMLYNEYALNISKNANLGLAKTIYNQLSLKKTETGQ